MNFPKRKPTRLAGYDYGTPGAYFITICTKDRRCLLGEVKNNEMCLSGLGEITEKEILGIESHYQGVKVDKYVIMPNHIHMIIFIERAEGMNPFPTIRTNVPDIIGKFKAGVSRIVGNAFMHSGKIWQSSYHDHIIRGDKDYLKIWEYIDTNVMRWKDDCFYKK